MPLTINRAWPITAVSTDPPVATHDSRREKRGKGILRQPSVIDQATQASGKGRRSRSEGSAACRNEADHTAGPPSPPPDAARDRRADVLRLKRTSAAPRGGRESRRPACENT